MSHLQSVCVCVCTPEWATESDRGGRGAAAASDQPTDRDALFGVSNPDLE